MKNSNKLINEILGQLYQEECLHRCLKEVIQIHPERILILHYIAMNIDHLSRTEIRERAFRYGQTIQEDELLARQIFLCLLYLADMQPETI